MPWVTPWPEVTASKSGDSEVFQFRTWHREEVATHAQANLSTFLKDVCLASKSARHYVMLWIKEPLKY